MSEEFFVVLLYLKELHRNPAGVRIFYFDSGGLLVVFGVLRPQTPDSTFPTVKLEKSREKSPLPGMQISASNVLYSI